ncbi:MAG: BTAD domain-containing putative transcriptional regulator [Anaerolineales bacterium]
MPSLQIFALGTPLVELNGTPVVLPRKKALALLVYLALSDQAVPREKLADLLWDDRASDSRTNLRRVLFTLREHLGKEWFVDETQTLDLANRDAVWVDVRVFDELSSPNSRLLPAQLQAIVRPVAQWKQAVDLYRDVFLDGFYIRAGDFEQWQSTQQRLWEQRMVVLLHNLTQTLILQENYSQALPYARRWAEMEETDESAHRALMTIYWKNGQRAQALKQYDHYQRVMRNYGLPPSPMLTTFSEQLRQNSREKAPFLEKKHPNPEIPAQPAMPPYLSSFVGRQKDIEDILQYLQAPHCHLLTILGAGGMGKTRLAVQVAKLAADLFPGGIFFVNLEKVTPQTDLIDAIGDALLNRRSVPSRSFDVPDDPWQHLIRFIGNRSILVILDNFEHLTPQADKVARLIQQCPTLRLLVTSRHRLNLVDEWIYPLQGLPYPQTDESLAHFQASPAVQLFVQRVLQHVPGFVLDEHMLPDILRLCQITEGMPLALEMIASWVRQFPCKVIADELEQRLDILHTQARDIPDRHHSLRASCNYSWALASPEERETLSKLAVFRNGFDHRATETVFGIKLHALNTLLNQSWLFTGPGGRYRLHPLIRQYLLEKLADNTTRYQEFCAAHARYYAGFLAENAPRFIGREHRVALMQVENEIENVHAAWYWAARYENIEVLNTLCEPLFLYYQMKNQFRTGLQTFEYAILRIETVDVPTRLMLYHRLRNRFSWFAYILGNYTDLRDVWERSVYLFDAWHDPAEVAFCEHNLGMLAQAEADYPRAIAHLTRSLTLHEALQDTYGAATDQKRLGYVYALQGDAAQAEACFRSSLQTFKRLGDVYNIALAYANISDYILAAGQTDEARMMLQQALDMAGETGNQRLHALIMGKMVRILPPGEACKVYRQMVLIFESIGDRIRAGIVYNNLADALIEIQEYMQAEDAYYLALHIFQECGDLRGQFFTTFNLGRLHLLWKHIEIARTHLQDALRQALQMESYPLGLYALSGFANLFAAQRKWDNALCLATFILNHPEAQQDARAMAQDVKERCALLQVSVTPSPLPPEDYSRLVQALLSNEPIPLLVG